jgi:hypothetical protein
MDVPAKQDWQALTELTQGPAHRWSNGSRSPTAASPSRAISNCRSWPSSPRDQVFVAAFVRSHGSIKEMEQVFGVSYPTVKARLNRIAAMLEVIEINPSPAAAMVLERLKAGEITADQAVAELEGR